MGAVIRILQAGRCAAVSDAPARRVCAWCGAAEPAEESGGATTHGLCDRCLEHRIARPAEPPDEADTEEPGEQCG